MRCQKCNRDISNSSTYCRFCGIRFSPESDVKNLMMMDDNSEVHPNATWDKRLANYLIDLVSIYALTFVVGFVIAIFDSNFVNSEDYVFTLVTYLVMTLYYSICEYFWGKTIGKFITRTRVLHNEFDEVDFWTTLKRSLIRLVPFEFISFDNSSMMWHDKWTNTRVVDETKIVDPSDLQVPNVVRKSWNYRLLIRISSIFLWILLISAFLAFLLGKDGSTLFNLVLGVFGVLGFIWLLFGLPLGLIDLARKSGKNSYNGEHNAAVLLGGLVILGMVFSAYALAYILKAILGIDLVGGI